MSAELEQSVREVERLERELAAARRRRDAEVVRIARAASERHAAALSGLAPSYVHRLVVDPPLVPAPVAELEAEALEAVEQRTPLGGELEPPRRELEHERDAWHHADVEPPAGGVGVEPEPEIARLEPEPEPEPERVARESSSSRGWADLLAEDEQALGFRW